MVYVRKSGAENSSYIVTLPKHIVEKMMLKEGDEVAFIADSNDEARLKVIR